MNRLWHLAFITVCILVLVSTVPIPVVFSGDAVGAGARLGGEDDWHYSAKEINKLKKMYPEADAIIIRQSVTVEMDENGLATRNVMRWVALITDTGIRRYGDPRILFDSGTQELDVSVARVYMRDGTPVDCKENAFNQTTPFAFAQAPDYTNWQETVVTHVGIEKDCVAELHYTIRDTKKRRPWLSGIEYLAYVDPVITSELAVVVPSGVQLKHASSHGAPEPQQPSDDVYRWRLENVPAAPPIDGGVWRGDHVPNVVFSTTKDWSEVSHYIEGMLKTAAGSTPNPGGDSQSEATEEKIFEIHKEVLGSVHGVDARFRLFDSAPRKAERIYESAYAHSLDRAVLLKAKLKEAGIESIPVLVSAGRTWPGDVAAPEVFDRIHLEVHAVDSDVTLLLDPESKFLRDPRMMMPGVTIMQCVEGGEITRIPNAVSDENRSSLAVTLTVTDEGKLTGEGSAAMRGIFSPYYSIKGLKSETEDFAKSKVEGMFPAAALKSWNIKTLKKDFVEIGFQFEAELPKETEQGRIYLSLPEAFMADLSGTGGIHLERSAYPVPVRIRPCELNVSVVFEKLSGWELFGNPLRADETNAIGTVRTTTEKKSPGSDSKLTLTKTLVIEKDVVPSEEYSKLRSLLLKYGEGQIIFTKSSSE